MRKKKKYFFHKTIQSVRISQDEYQKKKLILYNVFFFKSKQKVYII